MSPTLATFGCPRHPPLMSFLMLWVHCVLHLSAGELAGSSFRKPNQPCSPCGKGAGGGGGGEWPHPVRSSPCPWAPERHCVVPGSLTVFHNHSLFPSHRSHQTGQQMPPSPLSLVCLSPYCPFPLPPKRNAPAPLHWRHRYHRGSKGMCTQSYNLGSTRINSLN